MNEKKKIKQVIGTSLIVIAGVTVFYQYRFSKVQENSVEYVVVASKQINIDHVITENDVKIEKRNKEDLVSGNIEDLSLVIGSVAKETIYPKEDVNLNRLMSAEEYKKKDYRLVSILCEDSRDVLVGYDVKPYDKVDIIYFDKVGVAESKAYIEGQVIYDLKSQEGVSYKEKQDGYMPMYALIWVDKEVALDIYEKQEQGGYFKFQLTIDRAVEEKEKK